MCVCKLQYLATCSYMHVCYRWAKYINFKQNIQKNRLKIKELPERKIGKKKSKIGSSLKTKTLPGNLHLLNIIEYVVLCF